MSKECKKCGSPAKYIQIDSTDLEWELSCGCGDEPLTYVDSSWTRESANAHFGEKRWVTDAHRSQLDALLVEMGL